MNKTSEDIDQVGQDTLDVIGAADKFNKWMYETIAPHCSGRILEIGSGIGNISKYFIAAGDEILLTDLRTTYCDQLKESYGEIENVIGIKEVDLVAEDFENRYADLLATFDTVFALNVVEHIEDDTLALINAAKLLTNNGKLVILVPAYQALFNQFDVELEHYRRYTKKSIASTFNDAVLDIDRQQYFNAIGILGWFVTGKILKKKQIPKGQMNLYNTFVPIIKLIDKLILETVGLSVITVGHKR